MVKKLFALMLALTLTATWLGVSDAQSPETGQVLRVATFTVLPDKRDQLPQIVDENSKLFASTKGIHWFKVGSDPATGEIVIVTLWNSQAEIDAFVKSDARKAAIEKMGPRWQGEPVIKNYHVAEAKK